MRKMKTVVTGGAGFIGSHMVDRLLADGHQVIAIDNFSTGRPENLAHQKGHRNLQVVGADVNDTATISHYFEGADWVFHFAALADIVPSIQHPEKYFRSNVDGTFNVLELCREKGVKRFI
jgi:UDP-glucose 4-epimerase